MRRPNALSSLLLAGLLTVGSLALAQSQPAPAIVRKVLATAPLDSVSDAPRHFRLLRITLAPAASREYGTAEGFVYVSAGELRVVATEAVTLHSGEAAFLERRAEVSFRNPGDEPAVFLHFLLEKEDDDTGGLPIGTVELFHGAEPLPGLSAGRYDFTLTQSTFPARYPVNAPHHRTGAALYYVLSGSGALTAGGKTEARPGGAVQYEPNTFVHQWANPQDAPLVFLQANLSQPGVPPVVFEAAGK